MTRRNCAVGLADARESYVPSQPYWNLAHQSGFGDSEVNDAGDEFREATVKSLPLLRGLIGPDAPKGVVGAMNAYVNSADKFSEAAGAHSLAGEINPLASQFADAIDALNKVCPQ